MQLHCRQNSNTTTPHTHTETTTYTQTHIPHTIYINNSFSEPQTSQHHPIDPFHPQKHFYPTSQNSDETFIIGNAPLFSISHNVLKQKEPNINNKLCCLLLDNGLLNINDYMFMFLSETVY